MKELDDLLGEMEKRHGQDKFRPDGTPYPATGEGLTEWARDFEDEEKRRVGWTRLWWGGSVSTVWLGLNHRFYGDGPPIIFESMMFTPRYPQRDFLHRDKIVVWVPKVIYRGRTYECHIPLKWLPILTMGRAEMDQNRYSTRAEAEAGHAAMVKRWKDPGRVLAWFAGRAYRWLRD